ncbi:MAG: SDR family NAD(P)-dependent oxidoreductase [Ruminococcaceae bacterium]|nr:SDR family NAD(P)-dependent oxidoreductase [Oscillospiraceae bacterium]
MGLDIIKSISHKYGSDSRYVLAGGGNTSFKDEEYLYIKGSGTSLSAITSDGFVKMSRESLAKIWEKAYSPEQEKREAQVLSDMMASRCQGEEGKRPSVETLLHNLFTQPYVLHVHPAVVNGLTCSQEGKAAMERLFPDAIWVEETEPGYTLAVKCRKKISEYEGNTGKKAYLLFLQNHGVFFAADSQEEMDELVSSVMNKLEKTVKEQPDLMLLEPNYELVSEISPVLRLLYDENGEASVRFIRNAEVEALCSSRDAFSALERPLSPDHIVYCKSVPMFVQDYSVEALKAQFKEFEAKNKFLPKIVFVKNVGMFAIGKNPKDASTVTDVWLDAIKILIYSRSFGGIRPMDPRMVDFISNWEVESYRSKVALKAEPFKRFSGKIAIVTGGAKGLGKEIASSLAKEGATVIIADKDIINGEKTSAEITKACGARTSMFVYTDVTDEKSVEALINATVCQYGGLDVFVSNAGVIKAGSIEETSKKDFEKVLSVNYTAYFICVQKAVKIMKLQKAANPKYISDIIEINSKSGLAGSTKNFAYSGSKFGGIGLTQSFALELAPFGIKVNAVCPGNLLDGDLWSDPVNGLFVQYLNAGKVPGAKTVDDVRKFYESKVPLGRGCEAKDVALAVCYAIEQKYETGQAIPVTGGQVMLS